jgi:hypothetical protein
MKYLLSQKEPAGTRILLIESGSRSILEPIVAHLQANWGEGIPIDLITCYGGRPAGLDESTRIFHVADYNTPELRRNLAAELRTRHYAYAGMICAAEPIMAKWRWWLTFKVPAKFFIINENGDYFWLNRASTPAIRGFIMTRMGLAGAGAIRTLGRLIIFPFAIFYLLLYTGAVHLRRFLRIKLSPS